MAVSAALEGSQAPFKEFEHSRASRFALLMAAAAASWVWQASPALAQAAPKVRIITGGGDFMVDLRPASASPTGPAAEQQPAAPDEQTSLAAPLAGWAAAPTSVSAPLFAQEPVISPAPSTETALPAMQTAQDTAATMAPSAPDSGVARCCDPYRSLVVTI